MFKGLRHSTHKTYLVGQRLYLQFCHDYSLQPLPTSDQLLLRFIAFAYSKKLSPSTISVYVSSVVSLHQLNGFPALKLSYQVRLAQKAVADLGPSPIHRTPITLLLLQDIVSVLPMEGYRLWCSVLSLAFFGALRGAEYSATFTTGGTICAPLLKHVAFIDLGNSLGIKFTLPKTKTTNKPIFVHIGCSSKYLCAVCMLRLYLAERDAVLGLHPESYLFMNSQGRPVTKDQVNAVIKSAVAKLGLDPKSYTTHSLRSGAATNASALGFTEPEIKALGHWSSTAYSAYIHDSHLDRYNYAARLAQHI